MQMQTNFIKRAVIFLLTISVVSSCLMAIPTPVPLSTAPFVFTPSSTPFLAPTETVVPAATLTLEPAVPSMPRPARVLILSIDGLRPDAIELTPMRNLQALMQTGAYSLVAQTINPSVTLVSHASMLTGLCPEDHGVDWNDYRPDRGYAIGTDLFDLAQAAGLRTVMVVGKDKLRQITEPQSTDVFEYINDRDVVIADRVAALIPQGFDLMFVHFPTPDGMGHAYGWLSPEQYSVIFRADEALQTILDALQQAGMREDTLIIVTADHGGHGTTHGSRQPEDMNIPWIAAGPGVQPVVLSTAVNTTDTAATAAWALGLPAPPEWDGLPVLEAFGLADSPHPEPRCP